MRKRNPDPSQQLTHPVGRSPSGPGIASALFVLSICLFHGNPDSRAASSWTEDSFEDFRDGSFLDAGSNLYVSAEGRLQMINRWDLNQDGFVDLVVPSGHAHTEKENTMVYFNRGGEVDARTRMDLPGGGSSSGFVDDLNQDGWNDLIVSNSSNSHVKEVSSWIYWGGAEGLSARNRTALPAFSARAIAAGDYNGDGWKDLSIACEWVDPEAGSGTKVSLIYWNSEEGFDPQRRLTLPLGGESARFVLTADLDGDSRDDLIIQTAERVHLLQSKQGDFETGLASQHLDVPGHTLAVGDFDADTHPDLAIGGSAKVTVLYGRNAAFSMDHSVELAVSAPRNLCAADVDLDGDDDLIIANYQTAGGATWTDSLIFRSDLGRFRQDEVVALPTLGASWVSARDLNEDRYPEIVFSNANVTNQNDIHSYVYWNEAGRFQFGNHSQLPTAGSLANAIGDIDNDGAPDVVFFNDEGGFRDGPSQTDLYWGDGSRDFIREPSVSFPSHQIFGIGQADLDDDGYVDLVLTRENFIKGVEHEQSGITIHWGSEDGFRRTSEITSESSYGGVRFADINKDGYLDMLTGGTTFDPGDPERKGIPIYWGSADGFRRKDRSVIPSRKAKTRGPLLADLNRDGWLDVAAQEENGTFTIWNGSAQGFEGARPQIFELGRPDQLMYIKAADLNRDGWLDLLLPQRGPAEGTEVSSFLYFGSPEGFSTGNRTTVPSYVPYQNTITDLDRDGWLDLVLTAYGGEVSGNRPSLIYWGEPEGFGVRPRTELPTYGSSGSVALDFDRDGWLDLFFTNHRKSGSTLTPEPHRHLTDSMLFWGGPDGYSADHRSGIPGRGPSGLNLRDPGNTYDRGFYEDYVSSGYPIPDDTRAVAIGWKATTPFGTRVEFQIRTADSEGALDDAPWTGARGNETWWTEPGPVNHADDGQWIQYRARFQTPNAGASPVLSSVTIVFE
jgi:hypothetical protein